MKGNSGYSSTGVAGGIGLVSGSNSEFFWSE